jgi:hypothetical protein
MAYPTLDGGPDHQIDSLGYYYAVTGGLFPTGSTPNGDNASGGTFRFLVDDPAWGHPTGAWNKDDWYTNNSSIALTLKDGGSIVYDNNGLEDGSLDPDYYDYNAGYPTPGAGAHVGYSMANNYDWIYAGYFALETTTEIDQILGYFVRSDIVADPLVGPFDPANPLIEFHSNIWSNESEGLLPTYTGSFVGDVFSSDTTSGSFSWSDTGYDRTGSTSQQNIYRLVYTLDEPITLAPGTYWFGTNATIVPEPATAMLVGLGLVGAALAGRSRR